MPTYSDKTPYFSANAEEMDIVPGGVVELRVHGVNGEPPEAVLNDPHPYQVTGDDMAGFYRRRREESPERTVEAYSWSAINSRKSSRAWWVLLFPFAAINFAGFLLPRRQYERARTASRMVLRLISVGITLFTVLWLAFMSMDLLAVQCATQEACLDLRWLGWLRWLAIRTTTPQLIILASLLPAAALGALWALGRKSENRYESYGAEHQEASGPVVDKMRLDQVEYWLAPNAVYVQAWLHTTAALGMLGSLVAFTLKSQFADSARSNALVVLGVAGAVVAVAAVAGIVGVSWLRQLPTKLYRRDADKAFWKPRWSWLPALSAIGVMAAVAVVGWGGHFPLAEDGSELVSGVETLRDWLLVGSQLLFAALGLLAWSLGAVRLILVAQLIGAGGLAMAYRSGGPWLDIGVGPLLIAQAALAVVAIWAYERFSPRSDDPRRHRLDAFRIFTSTGVVGLLSLGVFTRTTAWLPRLWSGVVVLIVLFLMFRLQIVAGRDHPAKEEMREAPALTMAALAVITLFAVAAATSVFLSQRLGLAQAVAADGTSILAATSSEDLTRAPNQVEVVTPDGRRLITVVEPPGAQLLVQQRVAVIRYPVELAYFAVTALAGLVTLVATVALRLLALRRYRWKGIEDYVDLEYEAGRPPDAAADRYDYGVADTKERLAFARKSVRLRMFGNLTDDIDWVLTAVVITMITVMFLAAGAVTIDLRPAGTALDIVGFAATALSVMVLATVWLVRSARNKRGLRKLIGILWDVTAFFPRRFHPLAPPCYAERSVLELRNRIIGIRQRGGKVVLVAHSEGTLLTAAALMSLMTDDDRENCPVAGPQNPPRPVEGCGPTDGTELDGIAWITYGCMLGRLFGRAWPDQLRPEALASLKKRIGDAAAPGPGQYDPYSSVPFTMPEEGRLPRWMNFGRYTDYLGGRVFSDLQRKPSLHFRPQGLPHPAAQPGDTRPDDVFFSDPVRRWRYAGKYSHARAYTHSFDYESDMEDPRFRRHVEAICRELQGQ
jgi:hypothetical protein